MSKKPLKVGFDLDGVLLYNPTRIVRPLIKLAKRILGVKKDKQHVFFIPHNSVQLKLWRPIWKFLHTSSLFVAPGYQDIIELIKDKKIEAYIITARYSFLNDNTESWFKKMNAKKYFKGTFINKDDKQPHLFKEEMIKKLDLDVFVEDNWDIVTHLQKQYSKNKKIYWIYNLLDRTIPHPYKFPTLKHAVEQLKKL